jgi:hypothetical protein
MAKFDNCESCGKYDLVRQVIVEQIIRIICIDCTYTHDERGPPPSQTEDIASTDPQKEEKGAGPKLRLVASNAA